MRSVPQPTSNSRNVYPASEGRFSELPSSQPQEAHSYTPATREIAPISRGRTLWNLIKLKFAIHRVDNKIAKTETKLAKAESKIGKTKA